jgi:predicted Zn-dependent protease
MPDAEWEFVIFKDNTPNAFALSGGKVGINTGLFKITDSDALLAAVLGHEISHATSNHPEQRVLKALGTVVLGAVLWSAMEHNDTENPGYALAGYALASYLMDALPLSRRQEYESDRIGAIYMAKAGYDPHQAVELWRKLDTYHSLKGKRKKMEYLSTHPHDTSRIQALEDFMPVAMKYYRKNQ